MPAGQCGQLDYGLDAGVDVVVTRRRRGHDGVEGQGVVTNQGIFFFFFFLGARRGRGGEVVERFARAAKFFLLCM